MTKNQALLKFVLNEANAASSDADGAQQGAKALSKQLNERIAAALAANGPMPTPDEITEWVTAIRANERKAQTAAERSRDACTVLLTLLGGLGA